MANKATHPKSYSDREDIKATHPKSYSDREDIKALTDALEDLPEFLIQEGAEISYDRWRLTLTVYDNFRFGKYDHVLFDIKKEDLPLHINSIDKQFRAIVKWRLHHGC